MYIVLYIVGKFYIIPRTEEEAREADQPHRTYYAYSYSDCDDDVEAHKYYMKVNKK